MVTCGLSAVYDGMSSNTPTLRYYQILQALTRERIIIIRIIRITTTIFIVLSSWHSYCESSLGSRDEYRNGARWPPTFGPSQSAGAAGPFIYTASKPYPPSPFIIITQPES